MDNTPEVIPDSLQITVPVSDDIRKSLMNVGQAMKMANAYVIDSNDVAQMAQNDVKELTIGATRFETVMNDLMVEPKRSIEKIKGWFKPAIEDRKAAALVLKNKLSGWMLSEKQRVDRENREREEAERKARQEAEARAAAEMARAEEEARAKLKAANEAEAARKAAEEAGNKRAAAAAAAQSARLRQEADARLESGAAKAQDAHMQAAATVSAPVEAPQKIKGFSMATKWIAEPLPNIGFDTIKLYVARAAVGIEIDEQGQPRLTAPRPELMALLTLETGTCDRWAAGMKTAMRIPGMQAKETFVARSAKK